MGKLLGYIIAVIGLAIMAASFLKIQLPPPLSSKVLLFGGVILVVVGILLSLGRSERRVGVRQESDEVPIYAGEGKKKRIVGYQRSSK